MKKTTIFISLLLLHFNALAHEDRIITIWTSSENVRDAISKLTHQFELDFEAKVVINVLNKDLTTQFKTASISNKGPDIFTWANDVVGELAESGFLEPIIMPLKTQKKFLNNAINAFKYKEKLYGYPYDLETLAFIYNPKLLANPPADFSELLNKPTAKHSKDQYKFLYDIKSFYFSFGFLSAHGGYIFKTKETGLNYNDIGLANDGAKKGLDFLNKLIQQKIIPPSTDRGIAFNLFKKGKLAMTIDGPWAINDLKKSGTPFKVIPLPKLYGKSLRPLVGSHGFMIRKSSPNKDLAKELIERYLITKDGIRTLFKEDPRSPSRHDTLAEVSKTYPHLKAFIMSAKNGIPMPNIPQMGAVWSSMGTALNLAFNQRENTDKALENAVLQINEQL